MRGIIYINKPQHMTSHDVVAILRRCTGIKRIGHTGTLDPMATGVLPVCIGNATRIMDYLDQEEKEYLAEMTFGYTTDTYDIWGKKVNIFDSVVPSKEKLETVLPSFLGTIEQIPPMYSAIKVKGRKLYEYARKGQQVEVKSRRITISKLQLVDYGDNRATITVRCARGTYIRSLIHDIGRQIGCGAVMSSLERRESCGFYIEDAFAIEDVKEMSREQIKEHLYPVDFPLGHLGVLEFSVNQANSLIDGKEVTIRPSQITKEPVSGRVYRVYRKGCFIGIVTRTEQDTAVADKIFCVEKI